MVLPPSRPFIVCGTNAYLHLPINWMGICTLTFLIPQMNIVPNNWTLAIPLTAHMRSKRAIQLTPLLVGLGIMAGIGMGIGGIASSTTFYHTPSKDFTDDIERIAKSLVALQDQPDSPAGVVLQNRRGLDLLTGEGNGTPLQYSCLENPMDGGAWYAAVHGVAKSQT